MKTAPFEVGDRVRVPVNHYADYGVGTIAEINYGRTALPFRVSWSVAGYSADVSTWFDANELRPALTGLDQMLRYVP